MTLLRSITTLIIAVMQLPYDQLYAQTTKDFCASTFSFEEYHSDNIRLPYRQAVTTNSESPSRLIIYLHGGTSKGDDNISPINEAGVDSIMRFITNNHLSSVFIVPQCPVNESWGGKLTGVLRGLIDNCKFHFTEIKDIYLLGGSMGGTGTWNMVSKYPRLFSAAMPVAGNPAKCDVENVAQTPLFIVMGANDRIMGTDMVKDFISQLNTAGAQYIFDIEEGWTHEDTCIKSYTMQRLKWLFSYSKQSESSSISPPNIPRQPTLTDTKYWTLSGKSVVNPTEGFYLIQQIYSDKSIKTSKLYIR